MQEDDEDIYGDIISEQAAARRGFEYSRDARGRIAEAHHPAPLLIDELYRRNTIGHDHHFHGVQLIAMRKLFLRPVAGNYGVLHVRRGEGEAASRPVRMQDNDYLIVLKGIRHPGQVGLVREVCDEAADPMLYYRFGLAGHAVRAAFDALCDSVEALWDLKREAREAAERVRDA